MPTARWPCCPAFLSWLEHDHKIERNPAGVFAVRPENQRQYPPDERRNRRAHLALAGDNHDPPAALTLRLALLTGCRIGEAIGITAEQIDIAQGLDQTGIDDQAEELHIVPLQPEALAIARGCWICRGPNMRTAASLVARAQDHRPRGRPHPRPRHPEQSLARNGACLMQIGKVLGHTAPHHDGALRAPVDTDLVDLIERSS